MTEFDAERPMPDAERSVPAEPPQVPADVEEQRRVVPIDDDDRADDG